MATDRLAQIRERHKRLMALPRGSAYWYSGVDQDMDWLLAHVERLERAWKLVQKCHASCVSGACREARAALRGEDTGVL